MAAGKVGLKGELKTRLRKHMLFHMRFPFGLGRLFLTRDNGEGLFGGTQFHSHLAAEVVRDGRVVANLDLGSGVVTTAGVTLLAADWTNATATLKLMKFHDSGTGTTAAAIGDVALQTATGIARVSGTQNNTTNVYQTTGTITYNGTYSVTEWGLFSAATSGVMWDHRIFTAIPVVNQDQITYTYSLTCVAGG